MTTTLQFIAPRASLATAQPVFVRQRMRFYVCLSVAFIVLASLSQLLLADPPNLAKDVSIILPQGTSDREAGNVKITFTDGHTEMVTHTGDCYKAKLSAQGNVGWIRIGRTKSVPGPRRTIQTGKDSLVVRLPDGMIKKFPPLGENICIMNWRFADDGKTLIVRSMGHHGPSSYVQYDLASGKVIDSRGPDYTPYAQLPLWVKPLADPDE